MQSRFERQLLRTYGQLSASDMQLISRYRQLQTAAQSHEELLNAVISPV